LGGGRGGEEGDSPGREKSRLGLLDVKRGTYLEKKKKRIEKNTSQEIPSRRGCLLWVGGQGLRGTSSQGRQGMEERVVLHTRERGRPLEVFCLWGVGFFLSDLKDSKEISYEDSISEKGIQGPIEGELFTWRWGGFRGA